MTSIKYYIDNRKNEFILNTKTVKTAALLGIDRETLNQISIILPDCIPLIQNLSELLEDYSVIPEQLHAFIADIKRKITSGFHSNSSCSKSHRYCKFAMREVPKKEIKDDVCTICLNKLKDDVVDIVCGHQFHYVCINKYTNMNNCCHICQMRYPI